jgi:WD40 repeat protein
MKTRILAMFFADLLLIILASRSAATPAPEAGRPKEIVSFQAHRFDIQGLAFSPDSKTLASCSGDSHLKLWDAVSGKNIADIKAHMPNRFGGIGMVFGVAFSADGKTLATSGDDSTIKFWDAASGRNTKIIDSRVGKSIMFSPDDKTLVCDYLYLDLATKKALPVVEKPTGSLPTWVFKPNGELLLGMSLRYPEPPSFAVWDVKTGKEIFSYRGERRVVDCVAFSPDGKTVVSREGDHSTRRWVIRVWDLGSGKNTVTIEQPEVPGPMTFSPDGKVLAVSFIPDAQRNDHPSVLRLFEASSGKVLATLKGHKRPVGGHCLVFSPNGRLLASGDSGGIIKIWRLPRRYDAE